LSNPGKPGKCHLNGCICICEFTGKKLAALCDMLFEVLLMCRDREACQMSSTTLCVSMLTERMRVLLLVATGIISSAS